MVLALDAGVFNHGAGVGLQAGHGAADVRVYFYDLFDGGGLEEGGGHALFDAEEDTVGGGDLGQRGNCQRKGGFILFGGWVGEEGDRLRTPIAVEPSLIASREYSTWKRRPSGEKVLA